MEKYRHPLITFEGIDFCGKSTQIGILERKLKAAGKEVRVHRDPGGTAISEKIRHLLLDKKNDAMVQETELFLYEAARSQLVIEKIFPFLAGGGFVILDRFYDSTTAYQGYGRGLNLELIDYLNKVACRSLQPGLTLLLDITLETFTKRSSRSGTGQDRLESAGADFFERVRSGYHQIAKKERNRFQIIQAENSIDDVAKEIWEITKKYFDLE